MKSATLFMVAYVFMLIFLSRHVKDLEAVNVNCTKTRTFRGPCPIRNGGSLCAAQLSNRKYLVQPFLCRCASHEDSRTCYCQVC
uniref:SCR14 n=1 Tax=Arabidopsis lyrata TaxID=59689 RepID=A0A068CLT8_ARALY|nr:SCRp [Arabidopsis lyrata]QES86431.1 SCR14 [Arabidopsis lyrata]